jgi:hypothetical protein
MDVFILSFYSELVFHNECKGHFCMLLVTQYKMATSTITLRTIDGQNRTMTVSSDMKIIDLKRKIADEFPNFAVGSQRLIYRGCVLEDAKRLPDYSISDGHVVHLVEQAPSERPAQQQPQQQQEGLSSAVIGGSPHVLAAPHSGAAVVFGSFPVPGSLPLDPATVTQSIIEHVINPNVLNPQGTQSQSSNAHTSGSPAVMATAASLMSAQEVLLDQLNTVLFVVLLFLSFCCVVVKLLLDWSISCLLHFALINFSGEHGIVVSNSKSTHSANTSHCRHKPLSNIGISIRQSPWK